jgi:galactoside O-acetyltransferase
MSNWMTAEELKAFRRVGVGVRVSRGAQIFGYDFIEIGDNVRIDTGVLILCGASSAELRIGSHVHIAANAILSAGGGIHIGSFSTVGFGSKLVSASDSFSGSHLVGPVFPDEYTKVVRQQIVLEPHSIITTDCTVLPGATMAEGTVLGAMSLLKDKTEPWSIYSGIPAKKKLDRLRHAIELGQRWEKEWELKKADLLSR